MAELQETASELFSLSSSENRDSIGSLNDGADEEFYEKIEAPKFVDFSEPDHYTPDDRYWFCSRVGCDQKHEEEMDHEAIYDNFVLRVMAARSPNVKLRKTLDRNASRSPIKCPLTAPPKSSKPRLTRMALISSFSKKMEEKKKVVRPLLKPKSTPVTKTKPVAAKYLTTPRIKKYTSDQSSFRSVQHPKPTNVEVPSRTVAKALVFHSPKRVIKVKTSVELRTPISKLCQGMSRLEISSQRKRALGYSSKLSKNLSRSSPRRQLSSQKVQAKSEKSLQTCKGREDKSGRLTKTKIKGQLQKKDSKKLQGSDESCDIRKQLGTKGTEESGLQETSHEEECKHPTVSLETRCSDLASADDLKTEVEGREGSTSEATKTEENILRPQPTANIEDENEINNGSENITSESCAAPVEQFDTNNPSKGERTGNDFDDGDDKENAAASDDNRMPNTTPKQTGKKIFGMLGKCDQVRKKVAQGQDNLKEESSDPVTKVKKPKATHPKPFRLRTDERGVLRESMLDRRVESRVPQNENENASTPGGKLQRKHVNGIQKGITVVVVKTPKRQERSKSAALLTPESNKTQERKLKKSNAMQRLERFKKLASPLPKQCTRPQGVVSANHEMISYLIPGQKLDVIQEASPEVSEPQSLRKETGNAPSTEDASASRLSSHGRRLFTASTEPKFYSTHTPRSCTKKLK